MDILKNRINELLKENEELKKIIEELEKRLKKYSNPERNKRYYRNNKEKCIARANERLKNLSKEKRREYARRAYLKRKEKLKNMS